MGKKTISRDTPLAEITLRRYEHPESLGERELVRKLCLSLGLLQPGDSRDVVVDVLHVLLQNKKDKKLLNAKDIQDLVVGLRKDSGLLMVGIAPSNIRRHLKRLKSMYLIENQKSSYRIVEFNKLEANFVDKIENFLLPAITKRAKDYLKKVDEKF